MNARSAPRPFGVGVSALWLWPLMTAAVQPYRIVLQVLTQALAAQFAIERTRPAPVEAAVQRGRKVVERLPGDVGQVELPRFVERRPDEVDEFGFRMDDALDALGDVTRVDDKKARVEAFRPSRRRDRAREKVDVVQRRIDAGRREPGPNARRRFVGRAVAADPDRETSLLEGLADRGKRDRARKGRRGPAN